MTTLTDTQVVTASGGLVELGYSQITSNVSITGTSTAQTVVIAPLTVVCDGSPILVEFFSANIVSPSSQYLNISLWEDGVEKTRYWASSGLSQQQSALPQYRLTPSAGSHTYSVRAFTTSGTGTVAAGTGSTTGTAPAFLRVSKIVQATQWPALTSGVIVCTSVTRPAAPTVGTFIFETDTLNLYVWDGAAWSPVSTQPTGTITSYAGSTSPSGWLLCDGAAVSRTTYASLFAALSTTYGAGDGTTTFNLPDLRGRMPIGAGNEGVAGNNTDRVRGVKGGDTRLTEHTHTGTVGTTDTNHTHSTGNGQGFATHVPGSAVTQSGGGSPTVNGVVTTTGAMNSNASHSHTFTGGAHNRTQGNTSGDNMTPFLVTNYIIKV
jgi:microcystin-dependent protein